MKLTNFIQHIFYLTLIISPIYSDVKGECTPKHCLRCEKVDNGNEKFCTKCGNGRALLIDNLVDKRSGRCRKRVRIPNCYILNSLDEELCDFCERGYYLTFDKKKCLLIQNDDLMGCIHGYKNEKGELICTACNNKIISSDGKVSLEKLKLPDNCMFGGITTSKNPQPCAICNDGYFVKDGYCEIMLTMGCRSYDETRNFICKECDWSLGYYAVDSIYDNGNNIQICEFKAISVKVLVFGVLIISLRLFVI